MLLSPAACRFATPRRVFVPTIGQPAQLQVHQAAGPRLRVWTTGAARQQWHSLERQQGAFSSRSSLAARSSRYDDYAAV